MERSPVLEHQFVDLEQQRRASTIGMWVFLGQEVMFFGALFLAYTVYRVLHPDGFALGSRQLDLLLGGINTVVLISSSFTMALAVRSAELGKSRRVIVFLALTSILGVVFLLIKGFEYQHKFAENLVPGENFRWEGSLSASVELFMSAYFLMTGMHALHMIIGVFAIGVVVYLVHRGRVSSQRYAVVENLGLYWHFVDIIWIFLFPLLYLVGHHGGSA